MKKEDLIIKWLDNNLNESELKAFKQLNASSTFMKIDQAAKQFKAPEFDVDGNLQKLLAEKPQPTKTIQWRRYISSVAAAIIVTLGIYFAFFNQEETTFFAQNSQQLEFNLPDASEVFLNAESNITFDEKGWSNNRSLTLQGEAFFKVNKGSSFTVHTEQGDVTVLGTQFTVKARKNYFEVVCYEGLVRVLHKNKAYQLPAGNSINFAGDKVHKDITKLTEPTWIHAKSSFVSVPFSEVIEEMQRQYNMNVTLNPSYGDTLFTGSFTHENLETALQAITIPLNLSYDIKGNDVVLKTK